MTPADPTPDPTVPPAPEDQAFALFAGLVMQQANMALMFLGRLPGPEGTPVPVDLDHARLFIDTLEMLAAKTRGNLAKDEEQFLQRTLTNVRMAFVDTVAHGDSAPAQPGTPAADAPAPETPPAATPETPAAATPATGNAPTADADDAKKRFVKKY